MLQAFVLGDKQDSERKMNMSKRMNGIGIILSVFAFLAVIWLTQKPVYADPVIINSLAELNSAIEQSSSANPTQVSINNNLTITDSVNIPAGKGIEITGGSLTVSDDKRLNVRGTLILSGGSITVKSDGAIRITDGTLTMNGGQITKTEDGEAVYLNDGTFTMNGGRSVLAALTWIVRYI